MNSKAATDRVVSMDQFRGYTVAGMFVVNFLGGLEAIHQIFKHNNTHFSYADSIMPSFLFAAGFSYRLTMVRRSSQIGARSAILKAVVRSMALVMLSLVLFGPEIDYPFKKWNEVTGSGMTHFIARLLKADLWEVLAIIGVAQLLLLPVILTCSRIRFLTMISLMGLHLLLCEAFNYDFVYGKPNLLDNYLGTAGTRAWDGGFFGVIMWAVPMLGGTLAYDITSSPASDVSRACKLLFSGVILMLLGYGLSCLTTLYDNSNLPPGGKVSPVIPSAEQLKAWNRDGRLSPGLADPPFVVPPTPDRRMVNYWMMDKRIVSITFILFSTGFAFALYGIFVLACDRLGLSLGIFRILGQNPLAAYIIHHQTEKVVQLVVPKDSPLGWCLMGLAFFFILTMLFMSYLDRHRIYLRL